MKKKLTITILILLFIHTLVVNVSAAPTVNIEIPDYSEVFEGQVIPCVIQDATSYYWYIDRDRDGIQDADEHSHHTFKGDDILLYRPEATPLANNYVDIVLVASDGVTTVTDRVTVKLYKLWFGDIHNHCNISFDSTTPKEIFFSNTASAGYLDFFALTDHAHSITQSEWDLTQNNINSYYNAGVFTTIIGEEWSRDSNASRSHMNIYHRNVQDYAIIASKITEGSPDYVEYTWQKLLSRMDSLGWYGDAITYPHHPLAITDSGKFIGLDANNFFKNIDGNLITKYVRGVEVASIWGTAIGGYYSRICWNHPYGGPDTTGYTYTKYSNISTHWVESFIWKWRENYLNGNINIPMPSFVGGGDTHAINIAGSGSIRDDKPLCHPNPVGLTAVWAVHNTRDEIWDALNNCRAYATQLYKIRANYFVNGEMAIARVIEVNENYLNITITANATYETPPKEDATDLVGACYPKIRQVWLLKNDTVEPYFKIVKHWFLNTTDDNNIVLYYNTTSFSDGDIYYVIVEQSSQQSDIDQFLAASYKNYEKWHTWRAFLSPVLVKKTLSPTTEAKPRILSCAGHPCNGSNISIPVGTPLNISFDWGDIFSPLYYKIWIFSSDGSFNYTVTINHSEFLVGDHIEYIWGSNGEPALPPGQYTIRIKCIYRIGGVIT